MLRNPLVSTAVLAAVLICAQVGLVHHRDLRQRQALRDLHELERDARRSREQLERQLESSRVRLQRLRVELSRSEAENAVLDAQLDSRRAQLARAQRQVSSLTESLRDERPPLEIHLAASEPLERIDVVATNGGGSPVDILGARGAVWVDSEFEEVPEQADVVAVPPGTEVDFFAYELVGDEPDRLDSGASKLQGKLCMVYARVRDEASTPWVGEYLFEYRPDLRRVAILDQASWPLAESEIPCQLSAADGF
jgi:hypothetical protein